MKMMVGGCSCGKKKLTELEESKMQVAKYAISGASFPFHLILNKGSVINFQHVKGAIVNAANERCLGGGGVDGAIKTAGGKNLHDDRVALPIVYIEDGIPVRCPVGESKMTGPGDYGDLKVPYVIHAVGPSYWDFDDFDEADELLISAYQQSLERAKEAELEAVAFSLISAGVYRGTRKTKDILRMAVETIKDFDGYSQLKEVHIYGFNDREIITLMQVTSSLGMRLSGS